MSLVTREGTIASKLRYLGVLAFFLLVYYIGPGNLLKIVITADPLFLAAAIAFNIPAVALKTLRWRILLKTSDIDYSFRKSFTSYFAALFIGCLTPGRLGEFLKAAYLSTDTGIPLRRAFPSVIIDRFFDLYFLLILGAVGLQRYCSTTPGAKQVSLGLAAVVLIMTFFALGNKNLMHWIQRRAGLLKLKDSWRETILEATSQVARLTPKALLACGALTCSAYFIFFVQSFWGAMAVRVKAPFLELAFIMAATSLLSLLPVSISGMGVRDASLIILLSQLGVDSAQAMAFSLMVLLIFYFGGSLLGFIFWLWRPIKSNYAREKFMD